MSTDDQQDVTSKELIAETSEAAAHVDQAGAKTAIKKKRKWPVVLGVVAVVLVAAVVGFGVWHAQPSFCNAVCHQPMDPYVEGYYSQDDSLLVSTHASAGAKCLDCHEPTLSQQVSEGVAWISGDFEVPMESRSETIAVNDFCLSCHDDGDASTGMDWDDIVSSTADWNGQPGVNPHANHYFDNLQCGSCHSMHGTSSLVCSDCHVMELPEGWE